MCFVGFRLESPYNAEFSYRRLVWGFAPLSARRTGWHMSHCHGGGAKNARIRQKKSGLPRGSIWTFVRPLVSVFLRGSMGRRLLTSVGRPRFSSLLRPSPQGVRVKNSGPKRAAIFHASASWERGNLTILCRSSLASPIPSSSARHEAVSSAASAS